MYLGFNPRAHAGRDRKSEKTMKAIAVSIHAPTRGATQAYRQFMRMQAFQSTRPRGARRQ